MELGSMHDFDSPAGIVKENRLLKDEKIFISETITKISSSVCYLYI